jgi:hypothetical protein
VPAEDREAIHGGDGAGRRRVIGPGARPPHLVMPPTPRPLTFSVSHDDVEDLKARLAATRWPDAAPTPPGKRWDSGAPLDYVQVGVVEEGWMVRGGREARGVDDASPSPSLSPVARAEVGLLRLARL